MPWLFKGLKFRNAIFVVYLKEKLSSCLSHHYYSSYNNPEITTGSLLERRFSSDHAERKEKTASVKSKAHNCNLSFQVSHKWDGMVRRAEKEIILYWHTQHFLNKSDFTSGFSFGLQLRSLPLSPLSLQSFDSQAKVSDSREDREGLGTHNRKWMLGLYIDSRWWWRLGNFILYAMEDPSPRHLNHLYYILCCGLSGWSWNLKKNKRRGSEGEPADAGAQANNTPSRFHQDLSTFNVLLFQFIQEFDST